MINKMSYKFDSNSKLVLFFTILTFALVALHSGEILSKKNNFGIAEALIQQFQPHLNSKKVK